MLKLHELLKRHLIVDSSNMNIADLNSITSAITCLDLRLDSKTSRPIDSPRNVQDSDFCATDVAANICCCML